MLEQRGHSHSNHVLEIESAPLHVARLGEKVQLGFEVAAKDGYQPLDFNRGKKQLEDGRGCFHHQRVTACVPAHPRVLYLERHHPPLAAVVLPQPCLVYLCQRGAANRLGINVVKNLLHVSAHFLTEHAAHIMQRAPRGIIAQLCKRFGKLLR